MKRGRGHFPAPSSGGGPGLTGKFIAADATGSGDGSFANPLTLAQWCSSATSGDYWMRGGTYSKATKWTTSRQGNSALDPIRLRSYPGEQAIIEVTDAQQYVFEVTSTAHYIEVRDVVVRNTGTTRVFNDTFTDRGGTFDSRGLGSNIINCMMLDGGTGIGHFEQCGTGGVNAEVYGNIVLDNGQASSDRAHGPGLYTQNDLPALRTVKHNFFGNGLEHGIKTGTTSSHVNGYRVMENIVACTGAHYDVRLVNGSGDATEIYAENNPITDLIFDGNVLYTPSNGSTLSGGMGFKNYYGGAPNDFTLTNNWIGAYLKPISIEQVTANFIDIENNLSWVLRLPGQTGWSSSRGVFIVPGGVGLTVTVVNNDWYAPSAATNDTVWRINGVDYTTYANFQTAYGDVGGSFARTVPPDRTWVFPNTHEIGRGRIVVFNRTAQASTVSVNVDSVLATGDQWYLYNAFNPLAGAIASGTHNEGTSISVPMTEGVAGSCRTPAGLTAQPSQLPSFGVFELRCVGPTWTAPPASLAV